MDPSQIMLVGIIIGASLSILAMLVFKDMIVIKLLGTLQNGVQTKVMMKKVVKSDDDVLTSIMSVSELINDYINIVSTGRDMMIFMKEHPQEFNFDKESMDRLNQLLSGSDSLMKKLESMQNEDNS